MRANATCFVWALLAAAVGCDGDPTLVVSLRSDFGAGTEVSAVDVRVVDVARGDVARGDVVVERGAALSAMDDLIDGVRVLETDVPRGDYRISAVLIDPFGRPLVARDVLATVSGATAITVVITRACRGVACPDGDPAATECRDGRCVRPECSPESPDACPEDSCTTDAECAGPGVACASAVCLGGGCGVRPDDAMCGPGATCDPDLGCVGGGVDAGTPDAGAAGTGLVTVDGSFAACPRVRPYCVTRDFGVYTVFDPRDGSTCRGPGLAIDSAHPTAGMGTSAADYALIDGAIHWCAADRDANAWAYRLDMANDTVEDVFLGRERCSTMFRHGSRLGIVRVGGFSTYASWTDLVSRLPMQDFGDPLAMCQRRVGGQDKWELAGGIRYGAWFTGAELDTCELATGVEGTLPLVGHDGPIDGIWVQDEIYLLSRNELIVFSLGGVERRRVTLGLMDIGAGLECAL